MDLPNRVCKNPKCEKPYFAMECCIQRNTWKASCCCVECYQELIKFLEEIGQI